MTMTQNVPMVWIVGTDDYTEGFRSYWSGHGPGRGQERCRGWLAAAREERRELIEREQDRQGVYNITYGLI